MRSRDVYEVISHLSLPCEAPWGSMNVKKENKENILLQKK
jgi:hypothetical protein